MVQRSLIISLCSWLPLGMLHEKVGDLSHVGVTQNIRSIWSTLTLFFFFLCLGAMRLFLRRFSSSETVQGCFFFFQLLYYFIAACLTVDVVTIGSLFIHNEWDNSLYFTFLLHFLSLSSPRLFDPFILLYLIFHNCLMLQKNYYTQI